MLLLSAKESYDQKDYPRVFALLEEALSASNSRDETISCLDLRVSTLLKQQKMELAWKDARSMVRLDKHDGRGYLRCGQLERLNDNHAAALVWYEHGLKNVPETNRRHVHIVAQHAKTESVMKKRLTLEKAADPFERLPAEIMEMVVGFFSYRDAVRCLRVSKRWGDIWCRYSTIRDTLDFTSIPKGKMINFTGMKAAVRRSRAAKRPVTVLAAGLAKPAARYLKEDMNRWIQYSRMQRFEVYHQSILADYSSLQWHQFSLQDVTFGVNHSITFETVCRILQMCEKLRRANFLAITADGIPRAWVEETSVVGPSSWAEDTSVVRPSLISLALHGDEQADHRLHTPTNFFQRFPNLQHLTFRKATARYYQPQWADWDLSTLGSLKSFDYSNSHICQWARLPTSLETLNLTDCESMRESQAARPADNLVNLRDVRVMRSSACDNVLDIIQLSNPPALSHFEIDLEHGRAGWEGFLRLLKGGHLQHLAFLSLKFSSLIDGHIDLFLEHCSELEELRLTHARITGVFITALLNAPGCRVRRLALADCMAVSPDAIEWARRRGVVVGTTSTEFGAGSGRRVRDW